LATSHAQHHTNGHIIFLSLGANIGNRQLNLQRALQHLEELMTIEAISSLYETEPVGEGGQPLSYDQEERCLPCFLNLACQGRTHLEPTNALTVLQTIEASLGRRPSFRNAPRPIDIDILLYGNLQVTLPQLVIPHPRMRERAFVLIPLAEIAPLTIEPISGQTIQRLASHISGQGIQKIGPLGKP